MKIKAAFSFFCLRAGLFFLPVAALLAFPTWVLFVSGELRPVDTVIREQQVSDKLYLYGVVYTNFMKYYKLHAYLKARPELVVLGSSHVFHIRSEYFNKARFYNASVGGMRLPDFADFIRNLPKGQEPKVVIAAMDPFFAKPDFEWASREENRFGRKIGRLDAARIIAISWQTVYRDFIFHKISLKNLSIHQAGGTRVGIGSIMEGNGFRKDGSYLSETVNPGIKRNLNDYAYLRAGESFSDNGMDYVEDFLKVCHERGIVVVGLLPPVRHAVYQQRLDDGYRYWKELPDKLTPLFKKYGGSFYDFSDPQFFGSNDEEFINDFHASETCYARIAAKLLREEKALSRYGDAAALEAKIKSSNNAIQIFEN